MSTQRLKPCTDPTVLPAQLRTRGRLPAAVFSGFSSAAPWWPAGYISPPPPHAREPRREPFLPGQLTEDFESPATVPAPAAVLDRFASADLQNVSFLKFLTEIISKFSVTVGITRSLHNIV
jgi:hypothetical protein